MSGVSPYALRACTLIYLVERRGAWVPMPELLTHTAQTSARIANVCQQLVAENQVLHARCNGIDLYGIGVQGIAPC